MIDGRHGHLLPMDVAVKQLNKRICLNACFTTKTAIIEQQDKTSRQKIPFD